MKLCDFCNGAGDDFKDPEDGFLWRECPKCHGSGLLEERDQMSETCTSCPRYQTESEAAARLSEVKMRAGLYQDLDNLRLLLTNDQLRELISEAKGMLRLDEGATFSLGPK